MNTDDRVSNDRSVHWEASMFAVSHNSPVAAVSRHRDEGGAVAVLVLNRHKLLTREVAQGVGQDGAG